VGILLEGKGAAEMVQGPFGMGVEVLEVAEGFAEEIDDVVPVMVMGHRAAEWRKETLRGIGLWVIGRGRDQTELFPVPRQGVPHHLGRLRRVDLGVVEVARARVVTPRDRS
jgi:hypothetical protein